MCVWGTQYVGHTVTQNKKKKQDTNSSIYDTLHTNKKKERNKPEIEHPKMKIKKSCVLVFLLGYVYVF